MAAEDNGASPEKVTTLHLSESPTPTPPARSAGGVPSRRCEHCKFFCAFPKGECRRNPPTLVPLPHSVGTIQMHGVFPPVRAEWWCGAFEASDDAVAEAAASRS